VVPDTVFLLESTSRIELRVMKQGTNVWQIFNLLFWFYLPFAIVGVLTGYIAEISLIFTLGVIIYNYRQQLRLNHWLWFQRGIYPPKAHGSWGSVFEGIYSQQKRNAKKRNELSALVRRFRLGAESLPDAVVLYDEGRHIIWCNQLAQEMLGLQWPIDKGNRLDNLLRSPTFIEYLDKQDYTSPFKLVSPTDEHLYLEVRVVPFESSNWTLLIRDITQVQHLEQMRKDFIANVSHELKTPLTVMRGYLEMTPNKNDMDDMMWQTAHNMMMDQATRMSALVEQLLSLSKMEGQQENSNKALLDVSYILHTLHQEALSLSENKHVFKLNIDNNLKILGNENELRSAFSNLVFNAVRYTPSGGEITISWLITENNTARFSVEDNGPGIDASHIPRLTERFYRVDEARMRETGGAGLGLSIVKHALNHHESKLNIESEVGIGSCFSFEFPGSLIVTEPTFSSVKALA